VRPSTELNEVVHQRARLGILAVTRQGSRADFTYLRTERGLTARNLSQHLAMLEGAGLITVEKGYEAKRARA
jgi:DNA-binding HxlR family transcriptional regulator